MPPPVVGLSVLVVLGKLGDIEPAILVEVDGNRAAEQWLGRRELDSKAGPDHNCYSRIGRVFHRDSRQLGGIVLVSRVLGSGVSLNWRGLTLMPAGGCSRLRGRFDGAGGPTSSACAPCRHENGDDQQHAINDHEKPAWCPTHIERREISAAWARSSEVAALTLTSRQYPKFRRPNRFRRTQSRVGAPATGARQPQDKLEPIARSDASGNWMTVRDRGTHSAAEPAGSGEMLFRRPNRASRQQPGSFLTRERNRLVLL
jgi:hypothetical protein